MATTPEADSYVLLMPMGEDGMRSPGKAVEAQTWAVAIARPVPGNTTKRAHSEITLHCHGTPCADGEALAPAVRDFFDRMREMGLPGVLDAQEIRKHCATPLDFTCLLTEEIADDLPDLEDEDALDDDFDNHPLSPLREAMVDACPEFSGEEPPAADPAP